MKRNILLLIAALATAPMAEAQIVNVVESDYNQLSVHLRTPNIKVVETTLDGQTYAQLVVDGCVAHGVIGQPALPVAFSRIEVPFCNGTDIAVAHAIYDTIDGYTLGLTQPVAPQQPSRLKSDTTAHPAKIDNNCYATNAFVGQELATVRFIGTALDHNLGVLEIAPVRYNPATNSLIVCREAEITVAYRDPDPKATDELFSRYNTPAFSPANTINKLPGTKNPVLDRPVRMVVVSAPQFRGQLDNFVAWKSKMGYMTDVVYTDDSQVGSTPDAIANYLRSQYTGATSEKPAPSYILMVGDHNLLPAFDSRMSRAYLTDTFGVDPHVTDLYYTTWTDGDNLPDCYIGRFSVRTEQQLSSVIEKTVMYESYTMPTTQYLDTAVLIAGVDQTYFVNRNDNGYNYCDPTMDYLAKTYINADNGFGHVYYYKNDTAFHPDGIVVSGSSRPDATAATLKQIYSRGAGWINYSAHGDTNLWLCPSLKSSDVAAMNNANKPSFVIGNCCLSNKFDCAESLSEAFLRRADNAGAAVYVGATNSTMWEQDFEWSVGIRDNISCHMNTTYDSTNLGLYDRLFHTHDEAYEQYATCAGAMVVAGNMVIETLGDQTESGTYWGQTYSYTYHFPIYYWEIYSMQGDPSCTPWLSQADTMLLYFDSWIANGSTSLVAHTEPYAYVGLTDDNGQWVSGAYADNYGTATLHFSAIAPGSYNVTSTGQGFRPRYETLMVSVDAIATAQQASVSLYPNPASGSFTVEAEGMTSITIVNVMGQTVLTLQAEADSQTFDVSNLPSGVYFARIATAQTSTTVKLNLKN